MHFDLSQTSFNRLNKGCRHSNWRVKNVNVTNINTSLEHYCTIAYEKSHWHGIQSPTLHSKMFPIKHHVSPLIDTHQVIFVFEILCPECLVLQKTLMSTVNDLQLAKFKRIFSVKLCFSHKLYRAEGFGLSLFKYGKNLLCNFLWACQIWGNCVSFLKKFLYRCV